MTNLTSLPQAIRDHVHDGDDIYAAGFTHLIPYAAIAICPVNNAAYQWRGFVGGQVCGQACAIGR